MDNPQSKKHQSFVMYVGQETSKIKKKFKFVKYILKLTNTLPVLQNLTNADKSCLQESSQYDILELLSQYVKQ